MSKDCIPFQLEYEKTKYWMRKNWPQAIHHGVFEDAFQDTFADYLELHDKIPSNMKHLTWFNMRMWNNVNRYEPFSLKVKAINGGYDQPIIMHDFFSKFDLEGADDTEKVVIMEQEIRKYYRELYPDNSEYTEIVNLLREGYSAQEIADVLGCSRRWVHKVLEKVRADNDNSNGPGS